ncbi:MAG TPA: ATP-dependent helicase [Clostridiales bacterium]|nr:ATP-dependent helicase [Clostridiales bacterium]
MSRDVFSRLAPFIRDYIYRNNWSELRPVQVEACRVIFDTPNHLLLSSGTASGKTEAAFLPVLTLMMDDPPASIGVLYIAPLKALINDQFLRLDDLLKEAGIPVWHWHGDVPPTHKQRLLRNPSGVLQITPESLESMLINKSRDLVRLFGDLRFVIIDEVHAFMGTDRGIQVQCQLERLKRFLRGTPRRIGLSATLGDYSLAEAWLAAGTNIPVSTPKVSMGNQKIRLSVEHFYEPEEPEEKEKKPGTRGQEAAELPPASEAAAASAATSAAASAATSAAASAAATTETAADADSATEPVSLTASACWEYLYARTLDRKCILFTNMREEAETAIATLRQLAALRGTPDIYHVHHGSVSASFREAAEADMKTAPGPVTVGATVSLEMGIDIGRLERILQLDAPNSVSSFLQRLGRSGRRGNPSEMWFVCREERPSGLPLLPYQIPWRLLQVIAIIELYLKERWVEPPVRVNYPLNMLYHQTMSILAGAGEMQPASLGQQVLGMEAFCQISPEDYRELLHTLLAADHLQLTEERGLILGLEGEKIVNNHHFYAVFPEEEEYTVVAESKQIGKIEVPPPVGERITLAGRNWEVMDLDFKQKMVFTRPVKGKIKTYWQGGGLRIAGRVVEGVREVLLSERDYPYLGPGAAKRLQEARFVSRNSDLAQHQVLPLGGKTLCLLPWLGTLDYHALMLLLRKFCTPVFDIRSIGGQAPYFILVRMGEGSGEDLLKHLQQVLMDVPDLQPLLSDEEAMEIKRSIEYRTPKFDRFIPMSLHRKSVMQDYIDLAALSRSVMSWSCASGEVGS